MLFAVLLIGALRVSALDEVDITWYAPFFSGGGYCSEATSFMFAMESVNFSNFSISHHGDSYRDMYYNSLTDLEKEKLQYYDTINKHTRRSQVGSDISDKSGAQQASTVLSIDVCHSEPGAWHSPTPKYQTVRCPSDRCYQYKRGTTVIPYNIGRTMFETDRIPDGWVHRLNYMDEIWVPTEFARDIFEQAGVQKSKLIVLGEAVDTDFYRPMDVTTLTKEQRNELGLPSHTVLAPYDTIFLFVGKFETRKGLATLFRAYYNAFTSADKMLLLILTSAYHSSEDFDADISAVLHKAQLDMQYVPYPPKHLVLTGVKQEGMPFLYSLSTALVIPSHGEGWGRPHMEAMSCGTPVVATNWSGPTAFINDSSTGYLVSVLPDLIPAEGWKGHRWAQPNATHLLQILHSIHAHNSVVPAPGAEAGTLHPKIVGQRARQDMISRFSLTVMGARLMQEYERIRRKLSPVNISENVSQQAKEEL